MSLMKYILILIRINIIVTLLAIKRIVSQILCHIGGKIRSFIFI